MAPNVIVSGEGVAPSDTVIQYFELGGIVVEFADNTSLENVKITTPEAELGTIVLGEARDGTFRCQNVVFDGKDNPFSTGLFIVGHAFSASIIRDNLFTRLGSGIRIQNASPRMSFNIFDDMQETAG